MKICAESDDALRRTGHLAVIADERHLGGLVSITHRRTAPEPSDLIRNGNSGLTGRKSGAFGPYLLNVLKSFETRDEGRCRVLAPKHYKLKFSTLNCLVIPKCLVNLTGCAKAAHR